MTEAEPNVDEALTKGESHVSEGYAQGDSNESSVSQALVQDKLNNIFEAEVKTNQSRNYSTEQTNQQEVASEAPEESYVEKEKQKLPYQQADKQPILGKSYQAQTQENLNNQGETVIETVPAMDLDLNGKVSDQAATNEAAGLLNETYSKAEKQKPSYQDYEGQSYSQITEEQNEGFSFREEKAEAASEPTSKAEQDVETGELTIVLLKPYRLGDGCKIAKVWCTNRCRLRFFTFSCLERENV